MNRRSYLQALTAAAALAVMGASGVVHASPRPRYNLKFGHTGAPDHHFQKISLRFAKRVAELTNGAVRISVFPSDKLGDQLTITKGVMTGKNDMCLTSDTVLSNWVPDLGIGNLPFIYNSNSDYRKVVDGPLGQRFSRLLEPTGAVIVGWCDNGMRHITNNKREIKTPDDLEGLRIRVPEGDVFEAMFKALGADPVRIPFGELLTAMREKKVDAQENPPAHILTQGFYKLHKYVSRTGHMHMGSPIIVNKALLEGMPREYREAIFQAGREMGPIHSKMVDDLEAKQWKTLAERGMKITDVNKKPFRAAVRPVIDGFRQRLNSALIDDVQKCVAGKK